MSQPDSENTVEKQNKPHLFQPGESGNPLGRPKGARNKATVLAETLIDGQAEKIVQKIVELALAGDGPALKLCLERILPPMKSRPVNIKLSETKTAEGVAEAQSTVVLAVAEGTLTPDEGTTLSGILEARRKAIETQDHESRIAELEKENNGRKR